MQTRAPIPQQRTSFMIAAAGAILMGTGSPNTPTAPRDRPLHAVIHGHPVQPRESQLQALGEPDVTPTESAEIDELYRKLMPNSHVDKQRPD